MNRQDFIDGLRAALSGRIPQPLVEENIAYYNDYINVEMRKGRTEEDVMAMLGDPRLIARTIVETSGQELDGIEEAGRRAAYEEPQRQRYGSHRLIRLPGWLMVVLVIVSGVALFSLVFSVLSFFSPIILVFLAVLFFVKLFRDWLH